MIYVYWAYLKITSENQFVSKRVGKYRQNLRLMGSRNLSEPLFWMRNGLFFLDNRAASLLSRDLFPDEQMRYLSTYLSKLNNTVYPNI